MEKLHTLLFRISRLSVWVFGAGYLLIALATTLDVILRNSVGGAVPGVYEISGYIFAIATTWALVLCCLSAPMCALTWPI